MEMIQGPNKPPEVGAPAPPVVKSDDGPNNPDCGWLVAIPIGSY